MIDKEKAHDGRIRFGEMLNEAREREGLSCEELGKLVGVSRQTIFKIEKGYFSVGADHLFLVASALGYEWELKKR